MASFCRRVTNSVVGGFLLASSWVAAEDLVNVRFYPGYPSPNMSSEFMQLSVSRIPAAVPAEKWDIDRYFDTVQRVLLEGEVPASWGVIAVDAPFVTIEVALGETHFELATTYG